MSVLLTKVQNVNTNLVQDIVGFVQQNPPELGGGFAGVLLHAASNTVDVAQDVLQQSANTNTHTRKLASCTQGYMRLWM